MTEVLRLVRLAQEATDHGHEDDCDTCRIARAGGVVLHPDTVLAYEGVVDKAYKLLTGIGTNTEATTALDIALNDLAIEADRYK